MCVAAGPSIIAGHAMDRLSLHRPLGAIVLHDAAALDAVRDGWERLADEAATLPTQDFAWAKACAETVDAGLPLAVLAVGDLDQPCAIAPLLGEGGQLEFLGAARLREPADLLFADPQALGRLAEAISRMRRPVLLRRLPHGSPTIAALNAALRPMGAVKTRAAPAHPVVALDERWLAPEGALTAARASDVRRARRRAQAIGELEVELLAPGPDAVDALLDEAYAIESRGWKGRGGTALAVDAARGAFYRRYAHALAERGELRLAFLRIDRRPVAMQIALEWHDRLWLLKIGHDEALARCSPGTLLLLDVVRDAAARGLTAVQMLGDVAPWTAMWTADVEPTVTVRAYPPVPRSLLTVARDVRQVGRRRRAARRGAS